MLFCTGSPFPFLNPVFPRFNDKTHYSYSRWHRLRRQGLGHGPGTGNDVVHATGRWRRRLGSSNGWKPRNSWRGGRWLDRVGFGRNTPLWQRKPKWEKCYLTMHVLYRVQVVCVCVCVLWIVYSDRAIVLEGRVAEGAVAIPWLVRGCSGELIVGVVLCLQTRIRMCVESDSTHRYLIETTQQHLGVVFPRISETERRRSIGQLNVLPMMLCLWFGMCSLREKQKVRWDPKTCAKLGWREDRTIFTQFFRNINDMEFQYFFFDNVAEIQRSKSQAFER